VRPAPRNIPRLVIGAITELTFKPSVTITKPPQKGVRHNRQELPRAWTRDCGVLPLRWSSWEAAG
jgi:hypothetical protein